MPLADLLRRVPPTGGLARRLPAIDVTDDWDRRSLYGIVLTRGRRNDMARFVNARLLREYWPELSGSLDPKIRRGCARWLKRAR